jgi:membrane protease YdiL (CAAX protease family)
MPDIGQHAEVLVPLLSMLLLLICWAMFVAWAWLIWRLVTGQSILPERPLVTRGEPLWGAGTILLVFLSYVGVSFLISISYPLVALGLPVKAADLPLAGGMVDGSELTGKASSAARHHKASVTAPGQVDLRPRFSAIAAAPSVAIGLDGIPAVKKVDDEKKVPLSHLMLLNAVVEIAMLILVPIVVSLTCGARLRDFGLSFGGWWRQAGVGAVAVLIAAPPVNAIQILAAKLWTYDPHPVQKMMFTEFSVGVAGLAVATAVILAPMFEELFFRGLLQSWLAALFERRALPSTIALQADAPIQASTGQPPPTDYCESECELDPNAERASEPRSPYEAPKTLDSPSIQPASRTWLAIALTSFSFGFVHYQQWPAPIALFVLSLVIGTVYHRTGSLIAAISMHATFNGLSTLALFLGVMTKASQIK